MARRTCKKCGGDVIYKKHLIYTCNINDTHWDRIDEVIEDCFNQIKNIISAKNEDWTVILINNGIDKVKISYKLIYRRYQSIDF